MTQKTVSQGRATTPWAASPSSPSHSGNGLVSESFTAYGARRNPLTWSGNPTNGDLTTSESITRDGYTGHEALGRLGLNHMNGRVQDAITGRFLSADPFITEPFNTQNFNRYSYVYNNPLSYIDPSGFEVDGGGEPTMSYMFSRNISITPVGIPRILEAVIVNVRRPTFTPSLDLILNGSVGNSILAGVPVDQLGEGSAEDSQAGNKGSKEEEEPQGKNPCMAAPAPYREPSFMGFLKEEGLNVLFRTATVVGGIGSTIAGAAACATVAGCAGGGPMIALGLNSIQEGFSGSDGYLRSGAKRAFGNTAGGLVVDSANIVTSGGALIWREPANDAWKLFRYTSDQMVPAYQNMTTTGLAINAGSAALDAAGTVCSAYSR